MKEPKAVTIYETSDGRNFKTLEQAQEHERVWELLQHIESVGQFKDLEMYQHLGLYDVCKWFHTHYDLIPRIVVASK